MLSHINRAVHMCVYVFMYISCFQIPILVQGGETCSQVQFVPIQYLCCLKIGQKMPQFCLWSFVHNTISEAIAIEWVEGGGTIFLVVGGSSSKIRLYYFVLIDQSQSKEILLVQFYLCKYLVLSVCVISFPISV